MFWKTIFMAVLAIGAVSARQELSEVTKNTIKHLCEQNGAKDKDILVAQASLEKFISCVRNYAGALPTGPNANFAEMGQRVCAKTPELKTCVANLKADISPCLHSHLRYLTDLTVSTFHAVQLVDYQCHEGGQRMAEYLASDSAQCFTSKWPLIANCTGNLINDFSWTTVQNLVELDDTERCAKFKEFTTCLNPLEECSGGFEEFVLKKTRNLQHYCREASNSASR